MNVPALGTLDHPGAGGNLSNSASREWLGWLCRAVGVEVFGFRFENADFAYQGDRDPEWSRWSVGRVLLAHTIRTAFEDGIAEYRLLRGGEHYKCRFANDDPGVETLVLTPSLTARAALALYYRGWKLRRTLAHRRLRAHRAKPLN